MGKEKEYVEVLFEVTHRGSTIANAIMEYEKGTPEEEIKEDYRQFVKDVENNISSSWSYYGNQD